MHPTSVLRCVLFSVLSCPGFSPNGFHRRHRSCLDSAALTDHINQVLSLPLAQPSPRSPIISSGNTISKLWTAENWARHTSKKRYLFNVISWPRSTVLRGLLPLLTLLAVWSSVVWKMSIRFSPTSLSLLASPLALLLAFRVNNSISRFHMARQQWGLMVFHSRDFASVLNSCEGISTILRETCAKLLVAFGWCVKCAMRDEDCADVVNLLLPSATAEYVLGRRKPAIAILSLLRKELGKIKFESASTQRVLSEKISGLNENYGGMERLMTTPLSPGYSRHASRCLMVWLLLLPGGLLSGGCQSMVKLITIVVATAYGE